MNGSERRALYSMCHAKWGMKSQGLVLVEECGELVHAMSRYLNNRTGRLEDVIEECADVAIMIEQMSHTLDFESDLAKAIDKKCARLKERLDPETGDEG